MTSSSPMLGSSEMATAASPAQSAATSEASKQREKRLRDDPFCKVIGPAMVVCKRCGTTIKLSMKSTYDNFHWQNHRERCLRKSSSSQKKSQRSGTRVDAPISHSSAESDAINEYLMRSHPKSVDPVNSASLKNSNWRNWTWSQLTHPHFVVGPHHVHEGYSRQLETDSDPDA